MSNEQNCIVADKARALGQVARAWDGLARLCVRHKEERSVHDKQRGDLYDLIESLEGEVTLARTRSAVGAISQLMIAYTEIKCHEAREDCRLPDETLRRIERCLFSVVRYLEMVAGESAEDLGGFYYMPQRLDPFEQIEAGFRAARTVDRGEGE